MVLSTTADQFRCIQVAQLPGGAPQLPTTQEQPLEEIKLMAAIQPWSSHQILSKLDVFSAEMWIISKMFECKRIALQHQNRGLLNVHSITQYSFLVTHHIKIMH